MAARGAPTTAACVALCIAAIGAAFASREVKVDETFVKLQIWDT